MSSCSSSASCLNPYTGVVGHCALPIQPFQLLPPNISLTPHVGFNVSLCLYVLTHTHPFTPAAAVLLSARCQSDGSLPTNDWHKPQHVCMVSHRRAVLVSKHRCVFAPPLGRGLMPYMPGMSKATWAAEFKCFTLLTHLIMNIRNITSRMDVIMRSDEPRCVYIFACQPEKVQIKSLQWVWFTLTVWWLCRHCRQSPECWFMEQLDGKTIIWLLRMS